LHRNLEASHANHLGLLDKQIQEVLGRENADCNVKLQNLRDAIQNFAFENAEERKIWKNKINAIESLSRRSGELCESLKQEFGLKWAMLTASTREQMTKMIDAARAEQDRKITIVQGSISGLQSALEADRVACRDSHEEQARLDDAAEQKKDILKTLHGGPKLSGHGCSANPDVTALEAPNLGAGHKAVRVRQVQNLWI